MKIHSLQAQKTELNGRLLETQSTISSLKEEQRAIELAFQEKQNEGKLLRERYIDAKDQSPQVKAITEILQQKEAEIEDLKRRLQLPAKVGSLSTYEPSIVSGNETTINPIQDKNGDTWESKHQEGKNIHADDGESIRDDVSRYREKQSSMQSEEQRENGTANFDRMASSEERSAENGRTDAGKTDQVELKNLSDEQEDSEAYLTGSKELATVGGDVTDSRRLSKSEGSVNEELGMREGGRVRLKLQENSQIRHFRPRGKHSELRRAKGEGDGDQLQNTHKERGSLEVMEP